VRSRITLWARSASFQKFGSSASAFSSARRRSAAAGSKTPPQQFQRLLDLFGQRRNLGTHVVVLLVEGGGL
jgi:hypothetical protein